MMFTRDQSRQFTIPCTITVEHTSDSLEAHVSLDGGVQPSIGDQVVVHGAPVVVPFGESISIARNATVTRATAIEKIWIKFRSRFELTELYEVSFSSGSLS